MHYESILTAEALSRFIESVQPEPILAFDTEFVSEDRYRPELCLIQVATVDRLFVIDPLVAGDTTQFWDLISTPGKTILAHAAREECGFCYRYSGKKIAGLFDVQLAAGFVGMEYPISLGNLVSRLQNKTIPKGETRTNWRTRPLTDSQIEYALHDVTELIPMYETLAVEVDARNRRSWLDEEVEAIQESVIEREESQRWRKVSGSNGLNPRTMEVLRQLWLWRESRAKTIDQPARRVLRDDLMVELSKRQSSTVDRIRGIRGMERRGLVSQYEGIATAIQEGLRTPESELPQRPRSGRRVVSPMISQFLSTAIACICRQHQMAPSIVGNSDDVKELLAYEFDRIEDEGSTALPTNDADCPALLRGWRGGVVGQSFQDLLAGKLAIRVENKYDDQPLEFVRLKD